MKTILIELVAFTLICMCSCEKDQMDAPGNIPGMGKTPGDLIIKETFKLPHGITLIDQIIESNSPDLTYKKFGSGNHVEINLTLLNSNDVARTVFFPKGFILKNSSPANHNAILLQTTWVSIEPKMQRNIKLNLYCINKSLNVATRNDPYSFLGISGSSTIDGLLKIIDTRKINYEMIYGTFSGTKSGILSVPSYPDITTRLQDIVWNLTEYGTYPSDDDKSFIESIPKLSFSEMPPAGEPYPDYFPEFVVSGK